MMSKFIERFGKHNSDLDQLRFLITCNLGVFRFLANWRTAFRQVKGHSNQGDQCYDNY